MGLADKLWLMAGRALPPRRAAGRLAGRRGGGAVHLRLRGQTEGRRAVAPGAAVQRGADPRGGRFFDRRQDPQRAAAVPLLRPHRRWAAAGAHRRQGLPVSVAAALPGDPGAGLRPQLHGAAGHQHLPRQLRQVRSPLRFLPPALRDRRRREAGHPGARAVVREVRDPHLRRLRRHRDGAGAGGEHPDGLPQRHGRAVSSGPAAPAAAGAGHRNGRHAPREGPQPDVRLPALREPRRAAGPRRRPARAGTRPATWSTWMPTAS
jgi:hypothetical protein